MNFHYFLVFVTIPPIAPPIAPNIPSYRENVIDIIPKPPPIKAPSNGMSPNNPLRNPTVRSNMVKTIAPNIPAMNPTMAPDPVP